MSGIRGDIAFLLARLTWPSPIVRERAASAIAGLLVDSNRSSEILHDLLDWIAAQRTEATAAIGLLVLWRAAQLSPSFSVPPTDQLVSALRSPSLLSRVLLKEIGRPDQSPINWAKLNSGTPPTSFEPSRFFKTYVQTFVSPWYSARAEEVGRRAGVAFTRQWAFESQAILTALGRQESADSLSYRGMQYGEHFGVLQSFLSDVYLSAYHRAIAWAMTKGCMSEVVARGLAAEVCPVDLDLWLIPPGDRPAWWPKATEPSGQVDTEPAEIWQAIARVWHQQQESPEERVIVYASGQGHGGRTVYDLEIFGLFQKAVGPTEPDLKEIANWCDQQAHPGDLSSELHFGGELGRISPGERAKGFADWSVVPVAGTITPNALSVWQWWRLLRRIHLPFPYLVAPDAVFRCSSKAVEVAMNGVVVAEWTDWVHRLKETSTANLPTPTGNTLTVNRDLIREFEERTRSTFCWVCRLTGYHREHDYESYKTFDQFQAFGARRTILPR